MAFIRLLKAKASPEQQEKVHAVTDKAQIQAIMMSGTGISKKKKKKKMAECCKAVMLLPLAKAVTGEGSRNGKVIGHTKSGKPVYDHFDHPGHKDFTPIGN